MTSVALLHTVGLSIRRPIKIIQVTRTKHHVSLLNKRYLRMGKNLRHHGKIGVCLCRVGGLAWTRILSKLAFMTHS